MTKLIRDKVAEQAGLQVTVASDMLYWLQLKLVEEAEEVADAGGCDEILEELADVYEVMITLMAELDFTWGEVVSAATEKRRLKGGFELGHLWNDE